MSFRAIVIAAVLSAAPHAAFAQITENAAPPPVAAAPQADAMVLAVRDFYQAVLFDTGMFDAMIPQFTPWYREIVVGSDVYRRGNRRRRAALEAVVDRMPQILREELTVATDAMAVSVAPRLASSMTVEDVAAFSYIMRAPEWRPLIRRMVNFEANRKEGDESDMPMTAEDERLLTQLETTPEAQAIMRDGEVFFTTVTAELDTASGTMEPRLRQRALTEMCAALENDCPRSIRDELDGT